MSDDQYEAAIREFIDFVNRRVGMYTDASSGFAGNRVIIERQVMRISRPHGMTLDEADRTGPGPGPGDVGERSPLRVGEMGVQSWAYDDRERLETIGNADVSYGLTYDLKNRLETRTDSRLPSQSVAYEYHAADRLIRKTDYQGDVTEFDYDGTGRLVGERNAEYLQVSYTSTTPWATASRRTARKASAAPCSPPNTWKPSTTTRTTYAPSSSAAA